MFYHNQTSHEHILKHPQTIIPPPMACLWPLVHVSSFCIPWHGHQSDELGIVIHSTRKVSSIVPSSTYNVPFLTVSVSGNGVGLTEACEKVICCVVSYPTESMQLCAPKHFYLVLKNLFNWCPAAPIKTAPDILFGFWHVDVSCHSIFYFITVIHPFFL